MKGSKEKAKGQGNYLVDEVQNRHEMIRELLRERMEGAALKLVCQLFNEEIEKICGKPYSRKSKDGYWRGGSEKGSVYLGGQRVKVIRPRAHSVDGEVALENYEALRGFDILCEDVMKLLLRGVSTRDYREAINKVENGLGLKKSSVSRAFIRSSQKDLEEINGRILSDNTFVGIFIDGIEFCGIHLLVALGVTDIGEKVILGLKEGGSENGEVCKDLLESIEQRGFRMVGKILVIIDGSKALRSAVERVWGKKALIQRCCEHKIRNVQGYLPQSRHNEVRHRLKVGYGLKDYQEAKDYLNKTVEWLRGQSENAARSLEEGLEETLTVHKLGLPESLRRTFGTTNTIESLFSTVRMGTNRVKNWRGGTSQVSRWAASNLLMREKRMNKIYGYKLLPLLISKLEVKKLDNVEEAA